MADDIDALFDAAHGNGSGTSDPIDSIFDAAHGNTSAPNSWLVDSARQFGSGAVEGTTGGLAFLGDLAGFIDPGTLSEKIVTGNLLPNSRKMKGVTDSFLPAEDPEHNYARTIGQFVGPTGAMGALGKGAKLLGKAGPVVDFLASQLGTKALVSAGSAAVGAQGAEDLTGDTHIAPLIGALVGGAAPSLVSDLTSAVFGSGGLIRPSSAAQIKGSAALTQKELTGLTAQDIAAAQAAAPADNLGKLMTTSEVTKNPGIAQLEMTLGSDPQFSGQYVARQAQREGLRNQAINASSKTPALASGEGFGSDLIGAGKGVYKATGDLESQLWEALPKNVPADISKVQRSLLGTLSEKSEGFGLGMGSTTQKLVDQVMNADSITTGQLDELRKSAGFLLRNKFPIGGDLPTPFDKKILATIAGSTDDAIGKALEPIEGAYADYKAARALTAQKKTLFGKGAPGGTLISDKARPATVLKTILRGKGDTKTIDQLLPAIGKDPQLIEDTKRAMLDMIKTDAGGKLTAKKVGDFIDANEGAVERLFGMNGGKFDADLGRDHITMFRRIQEDLRSAEGLKNLAAPTATRTSPTSALQTVAGAISASTIKNIIPHSGIISKVADVLRKSVGEFDQKRINEWLFDAAMNPEMAKELAATPTAVRLISWIDRLKEGTTRAAIKGGQNAALELGSDTETKRMPQAKALPPSVFSPPAVHGSATPSVFDKKESSVFALPKNKEEKASLKPVVLKTLESVEASPGRQTSPKGAQGVYQIMPEMQKRLGVKDPFDKAEAGDAAWRLWSEELDRFKDPKLAFAAYNLGSPKLKAVIDRVGSKNWKDIAPHVPKETRDYVARAEKALSELEA